MAHYILVTLRIIACILQHGNLHGDIYAGQRCLVHVLHAHDCTDGRSRLAAVDNLPVCDARDDRT